MTERRTMVLINTDLARSQPSPLPLEQDGGPLAARRGAHRASSRRGRPS